MGLLHCRSLTLNLIMTVVVMCYALTVQYQLLISPKCDNSCKSCDEVLERLSHFMSSLAKLDIAEELHRELDEMMSLVAGRLESKITNEDETSNISTNPRNVHGNHSNSTLSKAIPIKKIPVQILNDKPSNDVLLEVCPEIWLGARSGYPFYYEGWKQVNCTNVQSFDEIITILVYQPNKSFAETCPNTTQNILLGLQQHYPKVRIIIGGAPKACLLTSNSSSIHAVFLEEMSSPGMIWNNMVKLVKTPYVLLARNLDGFIWTTNLERQVRMLSFNRSMSVAGGAVRNRTGHWTVGCFQSSMSNYILKYTEGYHASKNECMFCDYLAGPFVTRTELLRKIQFDVVLPSGLLFEDWFWRIKQASHIVVNCPDVMYLASDPSEVLRTDNRLVWLPLVRKWQLNRVVIWGKRIFSYSCADADIRCDYVTPRTRYYAMPICCIEQLEAAMKKFHQLSQQHKLRYELEGGSVLGAVKMSSNTPWDVDVDITFYKSNLSIYKNFKEAFSEIGMDADQFSMKEPPEKGFFSIQTPDIRIEAWGETILSHDNLGEPFRSIPTQVLFNGQWLYAPHSPGTFARNRFGYEVLQHSHSWMHVGLKDSFGTYSPGSFNSCPEPGFHGCLDSFSGDGNLQFVVPNEN